MISADFTQLTVRDAKEADLPALAGNYLTESLLCDYLHRAYALYRRLGYQQLQAEPYHVVWEFTDSHGNIHRGEDWLVDMMKRL